ncbi:MAG: Gfo/Idh/MocA family oxidoreductase [Pseudomonadota bacterium]
MSEKLGLALVGLGMAAKPHALALQALSDRIDVIGAFARSAKARAVFSETYGFPAAPDLAALAEDPRVDALLLITPPNARREIVAQFATRGKHILSEKPLERGLGGAQAIVETCNTAGVRLGVVFQHRFRAASEKLAALILSGELGAVRVVRANVPWWRDQSYYDEPGRGSYARDGGGVLISQAIHTLDLMLSLTGPVASVQAICATTPLHRMEAEDVTAGAMQFANGAIGALFASTASFPGGAESLQLDFDNGAAVLQSGILTVHWRDGRVETFGGEAAGTGGGADPMAFPFDWHHALIADFADAIAAGRDPRVTGAMALDVHRLIAALEQSSRDGRRIDLETTK